MAKKTVVLSNPKGTPEQKATIIKAAASAGEIVAVYCRKAIFARIDGVVPQESEPDTLLLDLFSATDITAITRAAQIRGVSQMDFIADAARTTAKHTHSARNIADATKDTTIRVPGSAHARIKAAIDAVITHNLACDDLWDRVAITSTMLEKKPTKAAPYGTGSNRAAITKALRMYGDMLAEHYLAVDITNPSEQRTDKTHNRQAIRERQIRENL